MNTFENPLLNMSKLQADACIVEYLMLTFEKTRRFELIVNAIQSNSSVEDIANIVNCDCEDVEGDDNA